MFSTVDIPRRVARVRTHYGTYLEFHLYRDGGLNIYHRTPEQVAQYALATDSLEEYTGGWAVSAIQAQQLEELFSADLSTIED